MARKRGRPPIDPVERRDRILRFRAAEYEADMFDDFAAEAGMKLSDYLRMAALYCGGIPREKLLRCADDCEIRYGRARRESEMGIRDR